MKKILLFSFLLIGLLFTSCATSNTATDTDSARYDEPVTNSKINNRKLEKNLDRFSDELNLSKRQKKDLKKIDKRFARLERKRSKDDDSKRSDRKQLAAEKRMAILEVLSPDQQDKLEALIKKGRFSFDQWFGK